MLIARATRKLLGRLGPPDLDAEQATTAELQQMHDHRLARTANRSVAGVMNEFIYLAEAHRENTLAPDLPGLAMRLATTPCGLLYSQNVSPDRELAALVRSIPPPAT